MKSQIDDIRAASQNEEDFKKSRVNCPIVLLNRLFTCVLFLGLAVPASSTNIIETPASGQLLYISENRRNPGNARAITAGNYRGVSDFGDLALGSPRSGGFTTDDSGTVLGLFGYNFRQTPEGITLGEDLYFDFTARPDAVANPLFSSVYLDEDAGFQILPERGGEYFGWSLATGDIDGDGYDDLIIGAPATLNPNHTGSVYIFYGRPDLGGLYSIETEIFNSDAMEIRGISSTPQFGETVFVDDINGNGLADIVIPVPRAEGGGTVYVIWGRDRTFDASLPTPLIGRRDINAVELTTTVTSNVPGERLGTAVTATDVTGNNRKDLVLSAPLWPTPGQARGRVVGVAVNPMFTGVDLADTPPDLEYRGTNDGEAVGQSLAWGRIIDPLVSNLVIGSPFGGDLNEGRVYIMDPLLDAGSSPLNLQSAASVTLRGNQTNGNLGFAVASAPFDSIPGDDLIIGEPGYSGANGTEGGRVFIMSGDRFPPETNFIPAEHPFVFVEIRDFPDNYRAGTSFAFTNFDGRFANREDIVIGTAGQALFPENCLSETLTDWIICHNTRAGTRAFLARSGVLQQPEGELNASNAWMLLP